MVGGMVQMGCEGMMMEACWLTIEWRAVRLQSRALGKWRNRRGGGGDYSGDGFHEQSWFDLIVAINCREESKHWVILTIRQRVEQERSIGFS